MLKVQTGKLQQAQSKCKQIDQAIASLTILQNTLTNYAIKQEEYHYLRLLKQKQNSLLHQSTQLSSFLKFSISSFESAETRIQRSVANISAIKEHAPLIDTNISYGNFQHRFHTSFSEHKGLMDYLHNGICAGLYAGYSIGNAHAKTRMKYVNGDVDLKVGQASISADAKGVLYQDGKFDPALILSGSIAMHGAIATGHVGVGTTKIHIDGDVSGSVGAIEAEGKAIIDKDEVTLKANVGIAALKGKAQGSISIFGLKISLVGSGEVGAFGAGAEFSSKSGEFEVGAKLSLIAGIGFKIKVSY